VRLDRFPLTSSGKVDKRALPVPSAESFSRAEYEAPRGEVEESLARIWQTVLGVERVGRNDNFFELGGHSLHVMRLNGMVAEHLGVEVGVAAVFQHSTITKLAIVIETLRAEEETLNGGDEFEEGAI
jgi:acyl carrier protein